MILSSLGHVSFRHPSESWDLAAFSEACKKTEILAFARMTDWRVIQREAIPV